jgi:hypothetical protein
MKKGYKIWAAFILPVIIGLVINWLTPINVLSLLWKAIKWGFSLFIIKFTLPVWAILLLMLAIPLLLLVIFITFKKNSISEPSPLNYISDVFFGIRWHWRYCGTQVDEDYLTPRCLKCSCVLEPINESLYAIMPRIGMHCSHCGTRISFGYGFEQLRREVHKEIDRKIVTGEYKTCIASC